MDAFYALIRILYLLIVIWGLDWFVNKRYLSIQERLNSVLIEMSEESQKLDVMNKRMLRHIKQLDKEIQEGKYE